MLTRTRKRTQVTSVLGLVTAGAFLLSACSGSGGDSPSETGGPSKDFSYLSFSENTSIKDTLTALSTGECSDANAVAKLKVDNQPQASFDQALQLRAGQTDLTSLFASGNSPQVAKDIESSGVLVDVGAELKAAGLDDAIIPAAKSTVESLYDGKVYVLPTEFNVEGIWYNKKLFADNGIEVPGTWDDLVAAADKLYSAGVQPFSADGTDGWPITRLVGNYIYRSLGADALSDVADGKAKLTDTAYVEAASKVAALGAKGYFGEAVGSIDYTTAVNQFLSGKAGMFYMGSWVLGNFNDPTANQIGNENIGFMPFPAVTGGKGSADELAANVGVPLAMSKFRYDDGAKQWLQCIAKNFGTQSLKDQGVITGFKVDGDVGDVPPLTQTVQDKINETTKTVLWFEALFPPKASTTSQTNAASLVTGGISPEDFMSKIQADLDQE
ncbi:ABC transporter substrate-binding protein [Cellulomonas sp. URHD0024]|uniref:ABC transporter substrate-binding protein n=1 Tax=Cellulomonas sp. URHD0024 TaxID=1302620 RepID=UPI0003FEBEB4|nr:extracellular solute-binding protein [Cellulomonas sp. URHD0024]